MSAALLCNGGSDPSCPKKCLKFRIASERFVCGYCEHDVSCHPNVGQSRTLTAAHEPFTDGQWTLAR